MITAEPWWQRTLDVLLPPRCVHCGRRGEELCQDCRQAIRTLGPEVCPRCSNPSREGRICRTCLGHPQLVRAIVAGHAFDGPVRSAILALKYQGRSRLAPMLGELAVGALAHRPLTIDVVVPVPLNSRRRRERGFNQSELIARSVSRAHAWPLDPSLLARVRDTPQQTRLPARERRTNVAGAFDTPHPDEVVGRRVLLIDDVTTTGATLDACAAPLLAAGAEGVWAVVVARDVRESQD